MSYLQDIDLQLIHDTLPYFKSLQNYKLQKSKKAHNKNFYKEILGKYTSSVKNILDEIDLQNDIDHENNRLNSSFDNNSDSGAESTNGKEYIKLLTYQQLLSLAGTIFFQLEIKNTSPGPVFSSWANYSYKDTISNLIKNLEGFGGTCKKYFQTFMYCILTGRISDCRQILNILKNKIEGHFNNNFVIEGYNSLDQIFLQLVGRRGLFGGFYPKF